ncbi:hypothetical protein Tco_1577252 [Tanacetum coccineum]
MSRSILFGKFYLFSEEQLLEPALNLTVRCCGHEFRVLNGFDQKSIFDEERNGLESDVNRHHCFVDRGIDLAEINVLLNIEGFRSSYGISYKHGFSDYSYLEYFGLARLSSVALRARVLTHAQSVWSEVQSEQLYKILLVAPSRSPSRSHQDFVFHWLNTILFIIVFVPVPMAYELELDSQCETPNLCHVKLDVLPIYVYQISYI